MAQHDYVLDNASGLAFRGDVNDALAAIVSQNSGTAEPSPTFAFQLWADTTNGLLKIRNSANNAWVTIGTLAADRLGLGAPFSGSSAPSSPYAYQYWIDTSGSPKLLKQRDSTNASWITLGNVDQTNWGLLPKAGGTMSAAVLFSNTDYTTIPSGTTAQRPGSPAAGMIRFNTDLASFEQYNGTAWTTAGGGGGVAVTWQEDAVSPITTIQNNMRTWAFSNGEGQSLYALVKVPVSYTAGQQISLRSVFYSADSSGNVYFKTTATLIRVGTDAITSTTNQRTSSQGAVTLGAGTVNKPQAVTCDLTSTSGQINSVSVAAGDLLLVKLYRDSSDTATGDAYLFPELSEVK